MVNLFKGKSNILSIYSSDICASLLTVTKLGSGNSRIAVSAFMCAAQYKEKQQKYCVSQGKARANSHTDLNGDLFFFFFIVQSALK